MHGEKKEQQQQEAQRNEILLTNLTPLLLLGSKRPLDIPDISRIPDDACASSAYQRFHQYWSEELLLSSSSLQTPSLWKTLVKTTGYQQQLYGIILSAIGAGCTIGPPQILRKLSLHFSHTHILSPIELWIFVFLLFLLPCLGSICSAHSYVIFSHSAVIIRNSLIPAIFRKSLVLSSQSRGIYPTGKIMNLFGTDILTIQNFFQFFGETIFAPAQLSIALGLIYNEVGTSMFVGLGIVLILLPIIFILFILISLNRKKKSLITDTRISLMNEILTGIRILKYYAWEKPFSIQVEKIRKLELDAVWTVNMIMVLIATVFFSVSYIMPIGIFFTFTKISEKEFDTTIAFTTLALLGLVTGPMTSIPSFLQRLTSARVSVTRIISFLQAEELEPYILDSERMENGIVIQVREVYAGWNSSELVAPMIHENPKDSSVQYKVLVKQDDETAAAGLTNGNEESGIEMTSEGNVISNTSDLNRSLHTLSNLNLSIKQGQLVAIIGEVGSGKSSILSLLLGDLKLKSGEVSMSTKSIAYHSQQPWILNATLRDNITCGRELDEELLNTAIEVSCLKADLKILPAGLDTEIGEKGINLSGGQVSQTLFHTHTHTHTQHLISPSLARKHVSPLLGQFIVKQISISSVRNSKIDNFLR
jgi:ATP-binding cassette, subfamily C (CFTR/MRP), member 1